VTECPVTPLSILYQYEIIRRDERLSRARALFGQRAGGAAEPGGQVVEESEQRLTTLPAVAPADRVGHQTRLDQADALGQKTPGPIFL
jgi:hypothetical protein